MVHGKPNVLAGCSPQIIAEKAKARAIETVVSLDRRNRKLNQTKSYLWIKWEPPEVGWVALNIDGAASSTSGLAGVGGLLRDHRGDWISGFHKGVGRSNSLLAELWAMVEGLKLGRELNIPNILVQTDAYVVTKLLAGRFRNNAMLNPLVAECRNLLDKFPLNSVKHVCREANQCADILAKMGLQSQASLSILCSPPRDVYFAVTDDLAGACFPRFVNPDTLNSGSM